MHDDFDDIDIDNLEANEDTLPLIRKYFHNDGTIEVIDSTTDDDDDDEDDDNEVQIIS